MVEYKTDISKYGKSFELNFKTDNKEYFDRIIAVARECIDDNFTKKESNSNNDL